MLTSLTIRIWLFVKDCHFLCACFSRLCASLQLASNIIICLLCIRNSEISLKWPLVVVMLFWWWHSSRFTLVLSIMNSSQSPSNYLLHQRMHAVISLAGVCLKTFINLLQKSSFSVLFQFLYDSLRLSVPFELLVFQGCYHRWFDKSAPHLPIWCRSCMAWQPQWAAISQLSEDENVNPSWGCSNEPWNHIELFQCNIL